MTIAELTPILTMLVSFCAIAGTVYTLFTKPGTKAQEAVETLAAKVNTLAERFSAKADVDDIDRVGVKVDAVEERLAVIESELKHLPNRDMTHAMELTLRELKGQLAVLNERMGPVIKTSERLQDFLLSQGK